MKKIVKTASILTMCAVIPAAFAATSRVGVTGKTTARLPSIAGYVVAAGTGTTSSSSSSTSTASYYDNTECIEKYTDCIKGEDVCGSDLSECTTNVLFHGKMANCLSVLYQCSANGISALFGTNLIETLSECTRDDDGDLSYCEYPKPTSVLGQLISGAEISNKYNTEQCVKSYTRCLNRDNICGADFELCTTDTEFKKQAVLCDSTLARCQADGKNQLFGSTAAAKDLKPDAGSRLRTMIDDGQYLAAMNAVKTCQKVTDNCLISACTKNPLRCVEGISMARINSAEVISSGSDVAATSRVANDELSLNQNEWSTEVTTPSKIQRFIKAQCLETIGSNQYCHMTYRETMPTKKDLVNIDLQEDVFSEAYNARKDYVNSKIQQALTKFDTSAKDKCYETIKSCFMRSCGGGLGSVCYTKSKAGDGVHVNGVKTYNSIKSGCSAIINGDANCIYAATSASDGGYQYTYYDEDNSIFTTLFPTYDSGIGDPIGAVRKLNEFLETSYNDAAIAKLKKQCENVALSCVKSMCGKDYINCYRNRTDIIAGTYNTGENGTKLDKSMNKMGGILDYNIVLGLCMGNVKNSSVCEEHLKIAELGLLDTDDKSWNDDASGSTYGSVRDAWLGANSTSVSMFDSQGYRVIGCVGSEEQARSNPECDTFTVGTCDTVDDYGCMYTVEKRQEYGDYKLENGGKALFQSLLADVEKQVQAQYNAKLTKEQNICMQNNNGGIVGPNQHGSVFQWVKLKNSRVSNNYQMSGLKENQFTPSNDLYGSFCRVRVTVMSDDKTIQDNLGSDAVAYFAVGDPFTCGSWISQKTLDKITKEVAEKAEKDAGKGSKKARLVQTLATAGSALTGGTLGYIGMDALQNKQDGGSLGGIFASKSTKAQKKCPDYVKDAKNAINKVVLDNWKNDVVTGGTTNNGKYASNKNMIEAWNDAVKNANSAKNVIIKSGGTGFTKNIPGEVVSTDETIKDTTWPNGMSYDELEQLGEAIGELDTKCNDIKAKETTKAEKVKNNLLVGGAAALVTGAVGFGITKQIQNAKYEEAGNEAVKEWMEEIGSHIQCYIGTEEAGSYGDAVLFEID